MPRLFSFHRIAPSWLALLSLWLPLQVMAQPALWHATRGQQQLYLFGSIHIGSDQFYPLPQPVLDAFNRSGRLWVEVDTRHISDDDTRLIRRYVTLPEGQTIDQQLPKSTISQLKQRCDDLGLAYPVISHYQSWYISILITQQIYEQLGYDSALGIDEYFLRQASKSHKPVKQLETVGQQFASLASLSASSEEILNQTLKTDGTLKKTLKKTVNAWQDGDQQALRSLLSDHSSKEMQQQFQQTLLIKRNRKWLRQLAQIKSPEPQFIVVGALHITGDHGLIKLLKKAGYQISQIE